MVVELLWLVPAHDQRDFEFAKKYNLPIKQVIVGADGIIEKQTEAYTLEGKLIDSESFTGLPNIKAKKAIIYHSLAKIIVLTKAKIIKG